MDQITPNGVLRYVWDMIIQTFKSSHNFLFSLSLCLWPTYLTGKWWRGARKKGTCIPLPPPSWEEAECEVVCRGERGKRLPTAEESKMRMKMERGWPAMRYSYDAREESFLRHAEDTNAHTAQVERRREEGEGGPNAWQSSRM